MAVLSAKDQFEDRNVYARAAAANCDPMQRMVGDDGDQIEETGLQRDKRLEYAAIQALLAVAFETYRGRPI